ncbi:hypothetical protein I4U23_007494 [Adineta vaga]|nr:hypothetical protein I4U23_007494 [Adineta vaga]
MATAAATGIRRPGIWKILLIIGIILALIGFILGWIGFGVPDWHELRRYNSSTVEEYYGLWAYCQSTTSTVSSTVCRRWSDAADQIFNGTRPSFISTTDGLITTGMIFLSLGLVAAIFALVLPLLTFLAGGLAFLAFLFIVIGVPIFARESNNLSSSRGDSSYGKRYGFGLMIATIVLAFVAMLFLIIAGVLYNRFGFGNIASRSTIRSGHQQLAPYNVLRGMPYAARPPYYPMGVMPTAPYQYPAVGVAQPSLLSQYIAQRMPRYYGGPVVVRRTVVGALPQPSVLPAAGGPTYVTPAYYRAAPVVQSGYAPLVNLTGRSLVGPVVRNA